MATLFNMYADTPTIDISGQLTTLRREEKDRTDKNWQGSKDLLRGAAVASIRKDYKNGISWDEGVKSADESFKRQYDRMMVADPAAAAQLREDYLAERTRRLNAEVAAAYKSKSEGVSGDIKDLEQEIMRLESEIQGEELQAQQAAQAQANSAQEASEMEGYTPTSPDAHITEVASTADLKKATPELYGQQARAEEQMQGYTPAVTGLRSFYGAYPEVPPQEALPVPRSGMKTHQDEAEARGMKGYRPLNAWYGGMK